MEKEKTTDKTRHLWVLEQNAVVVGMKHPTLDNEPDADIKSFDSPVEAESIKKELQSLDRDNQMFYVPQHRYLEFGIERKTLEWGACIAKTSDPFVVRAKRIREEAQKLTTVQPDTMGDVLARMQKLESDNLRLANEIEKTRNNANEGAVSDYDQAQRDQLQKDIDDSKKLLAQAQQNAADETIDKNQGQGKGQGESPAKSKATAKGKKAA